ncbi:glycosyltransferase [Mumia sp.]|uniref:glycosyltransferase n=1 Tax=Mumia sp. TaxID=1965300 RepID=UPI002623ADA5|nr:glycosyltransferase [Mumia sp.]MDD9350478.1 glycosyltransferase [Mumia sp.]
MPSRPTVAIAVLTFRRPEDIEASLPRLVAQVASYPGHAYVQVIDNDPSASARDVVGSFPGDVVRYAHAPTPGIAAARNRALAEVDDADLLVFIDDDERPSDGWLDALVRTYEDHPGVLGVVGPVVSEFAHAPEPWILAGRFFTRRRLPTGTVVDVVATNNLLLDLRLLRSLGLAFDNRFGLTGGSDTLFSHDARLRGGRFVWCDEALVTDVVPPERLTRDWVVRRSYRSGNSWSRTNLAVCVGPGARLRQRASLLAQGTVRVAGGALRWTAGRLTGSLSQRAQGTRNIARGSGMVAGILGHRYSEYAREVPQVSEPSLARPRVAVVLGHAQDPEEWRRRHEAGLAWDVTPYGYEKAQRWFDMAWARSHPEGRLGRRLREAFRQRLGFDLVHAFRNRRLVADSDVVWTHTEREHLAVLAVQRLERKSRRTPVIAQTVWLWDEWADLPAWRRRLYASLLRGAEVELVHSRCNREISRRRVTGREVVLVPFGSASVAGETGAEVAPSGRSLVLSIGNDRHRDWEALREAARSLPEVDFAVATRSPRATGLDWPANATVAPVTNVRDLAALYSSAAVVAVPLLDNAHASGATVCIEALSAGRPLVVSDAGGIADYVEGDATLVPVGETDALTKAIIDAVSEQSDAAGDRSADRGLTQDDYVGRYVLVTRCLLEGAPWDPRISAFAPVGPI